MRRLDREGIAPGVQRIELVVPAADFRKFVQRDVGFLRIGQGNSDGEIGDRHGVADEPFEALEMVVQYGAIGAEGRLRVFHFGFVCQADVEAWLDDVFEIERAAAGIELIGIPAQPAQHFRLALILRPQIGIHVPRECAQDGVGFPHDAIAIHQRRHLTVRVQPQVVRRFVLALGEFQIDKLHRRLQIFRHGAGFAGHQHV